MHQAFALLTIVPGTRANIAPTSRITAWFPWVGGALGVITVLLVEGIRVINSTSGSGEILTGAAVPLALVIVAGQAVAARLLHHDGLADVADAWWSGPGVRRRLEIMADSATGAFGAAALALMIVAHTSTVAVVLASGKPIWLLAVVPVFGRASAMFGAWFGKAARPGGLGSRIVGLPKFSGLLIGLLGLCLAVVAMFVVYGRPGALWAAAGVFVALTIPHQIGERFGGVTGDVLGASVLLTEAICLLLAAVWVSW